MMKTIEDWEAAFQKHEKQIRATANLMDSLLKTIESLGKRVDELSSRVSAIKAEQLNVFGIRTGDLK